MSKLSRLEATKESILLALDAGAPLSLEELIREVKEQAFIEEFAYALSALQYRLQIRITRDGIVEPF